MIPVAEIEEDYVEADLSHNKHLIVHSTAPFNWYLCEERLEVQVWVTFHPDDPDKQRPRHRDKLIGSAYLDLASLADSRRRHHRIRCEILETFRSEEFHFRDSSISLRVN